MAIHALRQPLAPIDELRQKIAASFAELFEWIDA